MYRNISMYRCPPPYRDTYHIASSLTIHTPDTKLTIRIQSSVERSVYYTDCACVRALWRRWSGLAGSGCWFELHKSTGRMLEESKLVLGLLWILPEFHIIYLFRAFWICCVLVKKKNSKKTDIETLGFKLFTSKLTMHNPVFFFNN